MNTKEKILLAVPALTAAVFANAKASGYASGYSDWSTTRTGNTGEVSRVEYRYADVSSWSACDSSHTSKPSDGHYIQGSYDPRNCTWWSQGSCASWTCNSWYVSGQNCSSQFVWCIWTCHGCGWWDNTWHSGDYWCEQGWDWVCSDAWSCNGWTCSSYNQVKHTDGACGNTATCYAVPSAWSSWSAWSTTAYTTSTSRKVETRTVYSYPMEFYLDVNGLLDGSNNGGIAGYGTFDFYVDGVLKYSGVSDFCEKLRMGQKWEIKNIKATTGHTYNGLTEGSLSGTMGSSAVYIRMKFTTNSYSVTVNPNGGTLSVGDSSITKNSNGTATFKTTYGSGNYNALGISATRTGYTAKGVYSATSGGIKIWDASGNCQKDGTYYNSSLKWIWDSGSSLNFYVQWEPNTYTITYNANGGTGAPSTQSFKFDSGEKLSTTVPTRKGYTFAGWYITETKQTLQAGAAIPTGWGSFTAVAQWTTNYNRYTVECLVDESGDIVDQTAAIGSGKTYKTVQKVFDVAENDTANKTFCIGKLVSKTKVTY